MNDGESFGDGSNIIYVNGERSDDNSEAGRLIADFWQKDYTKMNNKLLSDRVKHFKKEEGRKEMYSVLDEMKQEGKI